MDSNNVLSFDLICIGAGVGGLTAAITADELGLRPLVIEKTSKLGGVAAISGGQCWAPVNHLAEEAGIEDSVELAVQYMMFAGGGRGDIRMARHYCSRAASVVRFLADKAGVQWVLGPVPDHLAGAPGVLGALEWGRTLEVAAFPGSELGRYQALTRREPNVITNSEGLTGAVSSGEVSRRKQRDYRARGGSLAGSLVRSVLRRGIEIWLEATPTSLLIVAGAVIGVTTKYKNREIRVPSRCGVLLATGGYDSDADLARLYDGRDVSTVSLPSTTGDHLRLAGILGAKVIAPARPVVSVLDPDVPVRPDEEGVLERPDPVVHSSFPHAIIVNSAGRRFHNEADNQSRHVSLSAIDPKEPWRLSNLPCWAIWDSRHVRRYFGGVTPSAHGVNASNSIAELAAAVGIDPVGLVEQIAEFNFHACSGQDPQFGRGARPAHRYAGDTSTSDHATLGEIAEPPFYAVRLVSRTMGLAIAGLSTDEHSRVINWTDTPIPGLYAAGNAVALAELGFAYTSGSGNCRGMIHGFCAAEHAATRLPRRTAD